MATDVPELTDVGAAKRYAARHPDNDAIDAALHDYARGRAEQAMPIEVQRVQAAETAAQLASEAAEAYTEAIYTSTRSAEAAVHASTGWRDLAKKLPQLNQRVNDLRGQL